VKKIFIWKTSTIQLFEMEANLKYNEYTSSCLLLLIMLTGHWSPPGGDEAGSVPGAGDRVLHVRADGVQVPRHPGAPEPRHHAQPAGPTPVQPRPIRWVKLKGSVYLITVPGYTRTSLITWPITDYFFLTFVRCNLRWVHDIRLLWL